MNTHQKVFFTCAVTLGFAAAAFSATPAPSSPVAQTIELPSVTVVGHRTAPVIALEPALVIGHRNAVLVAGNSSKKISVA